MASLREIVALSQNPEFQLDVQAAAAVLQIPFHPNQVMHVAAHVDLTNGIDGITDEEILDLLRPENAPQESPLVPEISEPVSEEVVPYDPISTP